LAPDSDLQADENAARLVGLRLTAGVTLPIARFALAAGPLVELDAVARLPVSEHHRFEVGIEVGGTFDDVAKHFAAGVPLGFVLGLASHFETSFMLVPRYSRLWFASPYFAPIDAFDGRFELGLQFPFAPHVAIGFSPLAVGVLAAPQVDTAVSLDGRLWFAAAL
jgi:hypothetical protein